MKQTTQFFIQKNHLFTFKYLKYLFFFTFIFLSQPTFGCQGDDYNRTIQIVNDSYQIGIDVGATGNLNLMMQKLQEISSRVQQLPPSCQLLMQQMGGGSRPGGSGTNCVGGVCCDASGCY